MKTVWTAVLCWITAVGCATQRQTALHREMDERKETYTVKGLHGVSAGKQLSFGDYHTMLLTRLPVKSSTPGILFSTVSLTGSVEPSPSVCFQLASRWGLYSDVQGITKPLARDINWVQDLNSMINGMKTVTIIPGQKGDMFAARIRIMHTNTYWQLLVYDSKAQQDGEKVYGLLAKDRDNYYTITSIANIPQDTPAAPSGGAGFALWNRAGQKVAAVSTSDKGMVILAHVSEEEKFLLANACTALLVNGQYIRCLVEH